MEDFSSIIGFLRYRSDTSLSESTMADIGTRSTSGVTNVPKIFGDLDGTIVNRTIDNETRSYSLFVRMDVTGVPAGTGLRFYGAKITYDLDNLQP